MVTKITTECMTKKREFAEDMTTEKYINIVGARVNNLKNISLKIPRGKLVVISGLSGSGKSSLAFDTLFAEGQRRYAESLSAFARQFLGRMSKPAVDKIEGIPPAIAIEQKVNSRNPRSTVGTNTEIYDYLRLLFAKIGRTYSPVSGREVKCENVQDVLGYMKEMFFKFANGSTDNRVIDASEVTEVSEASNVSESAATMSASLNISKSVDKENRAVFYVIAPFGWGKLSDTHTEKLLELKEQGFARLFDLTAKKMVKVDAVLGNVEEHRSHDLQILVDRFLDMEDEARVVDSVETAFNVGGERMMVVISQGDRLIEREFSQVFEADGMRFEKLNELMFSFNNPIGACPVCGGYGSIVGIDESLVIPNQSLSLYEDAVACWRGETMKQLKREFIMAAPRTGFPVHKPYAELTKEQKRLLWEGAPGVCGINEFFKFVEANKYKIQYKYMLARYSGKTLCPECEGTRLRKETRYVKIGGKNMGEMLAMSVTTLLKFFKELRLEPYEAKVGERAIKEIVQRLSYIENVGLGYLTLSRQAKTLSGGESQRINLVSSLGSSLVGSLYILDEPSIGLHPHDTHRLIKVIKGLRDLGNSVVIVEHDAEIIRSADQLVDIGPYAGVHGGEVVYQGPVLLPDKLSGEYSNEQLKRVSEGSPYNSLTLDYLSGRKKIEIPAKKRGWCKAVEIVGAMENNLKNIDVKFPIGVITAVTGVSGSGKSSLVGDILYPALARHFQQFGEKPGAFKDLRGDLAMLGGVEFVDQNPIGKSSRSNPVTYLKIYDDIRKLFSDQPYAKMNGYGNSYFSFNIEGGRCPQCLGDGYITVPMQFMADVRMVCDECGGKRFKSDILEVRYQGKNISDVLDMSVEEAISFFGAQKEPVAKRVAQRLQILDDVGLGYVQLGQSSSTLSGGENQRIKLAQFLSADGRQVAGKGGTLFIFDEPTTGLHFHDIKRLLKAFNALVDRGHTIVVVEHNTDIIKACDWVIDLGPDGGDKGGTVCFAGTPENLAKVPGNKTGAALAGSL